MKKVVQRQETLPKEEKVEVIEDESRESLEDLHLKGTIIGAGSIVSKRRLGGATSRILMGNSDSSGDEEAT